MVRLGDERPEAGLFVLARGFLDVDTARERRRERMAVRIDGAAQEPVDHLAIVRAHGVTVPLVS